MEHARILIVGGGIVGTAIAAALAVRGEDGIEVVDLDLAGIYASSELNAGGARATWWQPVNVQTCRATLDFFRGRAREIGFREHGYLWLYADRELWARALDKVGLQNAHGLAVEVLAPADVWARFPLLDRARDEIVGATFSPRDGLVNPNAVRALGAGSYARPPTTTGPDHRSLYARRSIVLGHSHRLPPANAQHQRRRAAPSAASAGWVGHLPRQ